MRKSAILSFLFLSFLTLNHVFASEWKIKSFSQNTTNPVQYSKIEFDITASGSYADPFNQEDISVDMKIKAPSGKALILPCFFVSGDTVTSAWKARFTPVESGTYSCKIVLSKSGIAKDSSALQQFNAAISAKNGFVLKKDNWGFVYSSGKPFRGIGENIAWESRSWENSSYTYDYFLPRLASYGGNYYRTWMCPWNLPLEWKQVTSTNRYSNTKEHFNPGAIKRMDELVELNDSLGLFMMLTLDDPGAVSDEWSMSNYNKVNGGPATNAADFFTLPAAKTMYKNRLRYIIARWGYSPSIGCFEFFNELDNAAYSGNNIVIPFASITQWHDEMSTYIKTHDPYGHIITTSVSWRDITGLNSVTNIDFNQQHVYNNTSNIPSKIKSYEASFNKPYVIGEYAYDWDWNNDFNAEAAQLDFDFKRGLWYGLFTSTPIVPMSWWWEFFDGRKTTPYMKSVVEISDQMLEAGNGSYTNTTVTASGLESYGVKCGNKYFAYLLNNSTSAKSNQSVSFSVSNDSYSVKCFDPESQTYSDLGNFTVSNGTLTITGNSFKSQESKIYIISKAGDTDGILAPFHSSAAVIPGKIEAEDFDNGGEGIAYHDLDAVNQPGFYRAKVGVDIDTTDDGGYAISNTINGEWLKYSVNVKSSGTYNLSIRVAAKDSGKIFHILMNGFPVSGSIQIPKTGGLKNWQIIDITTSLINKGLQEMKIVMDSSEFSIDSLGFSLLNAAPLANITSPANNTSFTEDKSVTVTATASDDGSISKVTFYNGSVKIGEATTAPYSVKWTPSFGTYKIYAIATDNSGLSSVSDTVTGTVSATASIPGTIQAENYDTGGEGVGYHDLSSGNEWGYYRSDDVDIEKCTDTGGGYDIGDFATGEWLNYTVNVAQTDNYAIDFRVATQMSDCKMTMKIDGQAKGGTISIPNTGNWQTWQNVSVNNISLSQGKHVITLLSGQQYFNLNYFTVTVASGIENTKTNDISIYPNPVSDYIKINGNVENDKIVITDILGKTVNDLAMNGKIIDVSSFSSGLYFLTLYDDKNSVIRRIKFIKK